MKHIIKTCILLAFLFSTGKALALLKALNIAATGMAAQETNVSTISNNIANVNTTAFKRGRAEFEDLLYETITEPGGRTSGASKYNIGTQIGSGTKVSAVRKEFTQGKPQITDNPFDLLINGDGFFGIQMPNNEIRYTRNGAFNVDSVGSLVTTSGYRLFPNFTIPPGAKNVNISHNGTIEAWVGNATEPENVGQIPIYTFINPPGLKSVGENLYKFTISSGPPIQNVAGENNAGKVQQGTLETSNVSVMVEMTRLIQAQRAYQLNQRVMQIADEMLQTVNSIR